MVELAAGYRESQNHGEAGVDGAGYEIRGKDGGVPPGDLANREIEANHGVNGDDQRRREAGQEDRSGLVSGPMDGGAAPAEGKDAVNQLRSFVGRLIAQGGQVRYKSNKPKE